MLNFNIILDRVARPIADFASRAIPLIPILLIILIVGILLVKITSWLIKKALKVSNLPLGLIEILSPTIDFILWAILIVVTFHLLGFSSLIIAIGGSLAIIAIGLSRGVSATISDFSAGIFLSRDKDFGVGETVKILIGEKRSVEGEIIEMDIKKTRIKDKDGFVHVLSNSLIDRSEWLLLKHKRREKKHDIIKGTFK